MAIRRACAAILREASILMVRHQHDGRDYWTLPGGGVEAGETPDMAVIREVREETGLQAASPRLLFKHEYDSAMPGIIEHCFLVEVQRDQEPTLGHDPELTAENQLLTDVAWFTLSSLANDIQVSKVIEALAASESRIS